MASAEETEWFQAIMQHLMNCIRDANFNMRQPKGWYMHPQWWREIVSLMATQSITSFWEMQTPDSSMLMGYPVAVDVKADIPTLVCHEQPPKPKPNYYVF